MGAIAAAALFGWWVWGAPSVGDVAAAPVPVVPAPDLIDDSVVGSGITVHVTGAVVAPGLVVLPPGARVADAVAAADGLSAAADLSGVNLAAPVTDGEQVRIPTVATGDDLGTSPNDHPGAPAVAGDGTVAVNSADAAALETLPGVGPVLAARIISHRDQHGPFATVEDLLDVPGIGEGRLDALRDLIAIP